MMLSQVEITFRIPGQYGQVRWLKISSPVEIWSGDEAGKEASPVGNLVPPEVGPGSGEAAPPVAPLTGGDDRGSPVLRRDEIATSRAAARAPDDLDGLREAIREARAALAEWSAMLSNLDARLAPARAAKAEIDLAIIATHSGKRIDLSRKAERRPLFDRLDRLSREWGPVRQERRRVATEQKLLERQIAHMERRALKIRRRTSNG